MAHCSQVKGERSHRSKVTGQTSDAMQGSWRSRRSQVPGHRSHRSHRSTGQQATQVTQVTQGIGHKFPVIDSRRRARRPVCL
eukprot:381290-Rhodomonas_salina.2